MKSHLKLAMLALAAMGVSGLATGSAHAECKNLAAVGTGLTQDIAKFMADAGLKNIREDRGYKPGGAVSYKCTPGAIAIDCSARQRVCK
jgi:hypothetical protein